MSGFSSLEPGEADCKTEKSGRKDDALAVLLRQGGEYASKQARYAIRADARRAAASRRVSLSPAAFQTDKQANRQGDPKP
ncbi:hypothetical protein D9M70_642970 [compost metagenome]